MRNRLVGATLGLLVIVPVLYTSSRVNEQAVRVAMALDSEQQLWDAIGASDEPWLVEFYDPRCSSCQAFVPEWRELVRMPWAGGMRFATVNIEARAGMALATKLGAIEQGLPNVQLFVHADGAGAGDGTSSGRPVQHLVMRGDSPLSASALRQKVLRALHGAQLAQLGIEDEPDDSPAASGEASGAARDDLGD